MKFAILGAGGIGCYYAARLLHAGHDVVLVARGAHLDALQSQGLSLSHPDFSFEGRVNATDVAGLCKQENAADFDLLILASKGSTTAPILAQMQPWLAGSSVPMLSIQNGVTNEQVIAEALGVERTIGGLAVKIGAHVLSPGVVEATGIAQIDFGAWPNVQHNPTLQPWLEQLAAVFLDAGIPNQLYDDVSYALWRKLMINNAVNPITALTMQDTGVVTRDPVLRHTIHTIMQETARAASVAGVTMTEQDVDAMFDLICQFDAIKTSMLVDREKGRPMEIHEICGPVIENCRQLGEPAVTTELISQLLQHASGQRPA
ncbi:ketopantoate reductase family protein [Vibrio furnissii]|uniref:ketopantoate reductase family protein n=1 Tax=Vibrio furnissii TaxID=29494 RepID=UPI001EECCD6D|nr:2-dehydropantoate 2-reductase [Vibrio furnissii]MCG6257832.1 2-dehydropantoate 2-reductase [Vibrio furnissii]